MKWAELVSLILDLVGLGLISLYLFFIPKPLKFVFDSPYGIITDLQPIADAINNITRDFNLIYKMRFGFFILVFSQMIKFAIWYYRSLKVSQTNTASGLNLPSKG